MYTERSQPFVPRRKVNYFEALPLVDFAPTLGGGVTEATWTFPDYSMGLGVESCNSRHPSIPIPIFLHCLVSIATVVITT